MRLWHLGDRSSGPEPASGSLASHEGDAVRSEADSVRTEEPRARELLDLDLGM